MPLALLPLLPLLWQAPAPPPIPSPPCASAVTRGGVHTPLRLRLYVDPTHDQAGEAWLELRRLAAERPQDLHIELVIVRGLVGPREADRRLQVWVADAVSRVPPARVFALIERDGWERVSGALARPDARDRIERELGLDGPSLLASPQRRRCMEQALDLASLELQARQRDQFAGNLQSGPLFGLSGRPGDQERLVRDDPSLGNLRPLIDPALQRVLMPTAPPPPLREPTSPRSRFARRAGSYLGLGATVGGPGLPHAVVLFANDEFDARVQDLLEPALRYAADHPGTLAVQIISRGQGSSAERLRQRLCAARNLGLELPYARLLSLPREQRERPAEAALLERLDEEALERPCEDPARDAAGGALPRAGWLDGEPISRNELERLDIRFADERSGLADLLWGL